MKILTATLLTAFAAIAAVGQAAAPARPAVPVKAPRIIAESSGGDSTLKGAPFSAEVVNESVQTLADGNRIVRKWTSKMYRNSEGQFRREGSIAPGAAFGTLLSPDPSVTILDPVGGARYMLNTEGRTARVFTLPPSAAIRAGTPGQTVIVGNGGNFSYSTDEKAIAELKAAQDQLKEGAEKLKVNAEQLKAGAEHMKMLQEELKTAVTTKITTSIGIATLLPTPASSKYETRREDLGTQNIEGVEAEGTRITTIIPADAIGNERPIEIVYERWYSKDLHVVVFSRHYDPRFGEQTYRLTNINRTEPDPSLFEVPTGYRILNETKPGAPRTASQTRTERTVRVSTAQSARP